MRVFVLYYLSLSGAGSVTQQFLILYLKYLARVLLLLLVRI